MASGCPNFSPRQERLSLRSLASDTAGAALIEITLFMPILALMAVAIINFGLYFSYSDPGGERGAGRGAMGDHQRGAERLFVELDPERRGQGANNSSLPSVFTAISVSSGSNCSYPLNFAAARAMSPSATWTTSCALGPARTLCSDGSYPGTYVQVVVRGTFTPFANFGSFFPSSFSPSSTATVRVQ